MHKLFLSGLIAICVVLAACGGGGGGSSTTPTPTPVPTVVPTAPPGGPNVLSVVVDSGPNADYVNGPFASVTICQPGTNTCQTIDHLLVDTGSYGLRIMASTFNALPLSALPQQTGATNGGNSPLAECAQFGSGFTWGSVRTADVIMAGEQASNLPIQIIGDQNYASIPSACSAAGGTPLNSVAAFGVNGVLGVGLFAEDCPACATTPLSPTNGGGYYYCPTSSTCQVAQVPISKQIINPVAQFATDNNGVLLWLPAVPASGASNVVGSLVFGIGTRTNNALGNAKVLTTNGSGLISTLFNGTNYSTSFIDSGSNGLFFPSSMTVCASPNSEWYCPSGTQSVSATMLGANAVTNPVNFSVGNFVSLLSIPNNTAFNNLGGPLAGEFDWGLPFFFGRNVYTALNGRMAGGQTGPYFAY
ncbi:DUF3443 domain-containing protein [Andreprevotia chitinilytica]|uniref:DUF3443 domain-containing protein n=1 Tax=Andreprevotia chitinilytica TaxID=396808 RepID=UPI0005501481|nr:DUF3443 domain-containing protein [Andreprevotia chitinilytica]